QGKRVLAGYEIQQSLQAKIRNMEKIGSIIQAATDAGANEVGDLQITIDKEDELKKEARAQAIEKAKAKAKELASQLGVKLGKINYFNEDINLPYYGLNMKEGVGGGMAVPAPQIATGENKIQVTVSITYEIN
ncbi:MAG: SIMPL domain-containing protein, partial [bacterium]|nr:SIMPL domain-containing protein [bacterium]